MKINTILFDLGNTLIKQQIDDIQTLDLLDLEPLTDVYNTIKNIHKHYKIGIISNTRKSKESNVKIVISKFKWEPFIDCIVTSQDIGFEKPSKLIFEYMLKKIKSKAEETLMVGNDLTADIYGGRKAGMRTVFFSCVESDWIELKTTKHKPDFIIRSISEIVPLLKKIQQQ